MAAAPWIVSDELWELIEPLLPKKERRRRGGRSRHPDRETLSGILFVLHTGIAWRHLPAELGFGSGVTCCRQLDEWQRAGVWEKLHGLLLERLRAAGQSSGREPWAIPLMCRRKREGLRRNRTQEVGGSSPPGSTKSSFQLLLWASRRQQMTQQRATAAPRASSQRTNYREVRASESAAERI
jgi:transposase